MIFLDTETCGFEGPVITIQYAYNNDEPKVHHVWRSSVQSTLELIELFLTDPEGVCAFNLAFDWFHIQQIYTLLYASESRINIPIPETIAVYEKSARKLNICLKPKQATDLMLHARKGPYQSTMERKPITIKNVPRECADDLAHYLSNSFNIPDVHFTRRPVANDVFDILPGIQKNCVHLRLRFFSSGSLKAIIHDLYPELDVDHDAAKECPHTEGVHWSEQINRFIDYWAFNPRAKRYALADVTYLQLLHKKWNPPSNTIDDQLAVCVALCKWRGYTLDLPALQMLSDELKAETRFNPNAPVSCLKYLHKYCNPLERTLIKKTDKGTLQKLIRLGGPVGKAAKEIKNARQDEKKKNLFKRLQQRGRFYPAFKIIGARSGRMSGGDVERGKRSLNPQGIQRSQKIRSSFTLTDTTLPILTGGDFSAFEPTILDAAVDCPTLRVALQAGRKIYDIFGDVVAPKANYGPRKNAFLAYNYGARGEKIAKTLDIDEDQAAKGLKELIKQYPEIEVARENIKRRFCSISQPNGLGTEVKWRDPDEYCETLFGFRRYFTLENEIGRVLFDTACSLPASIAKATGTIIRSKHRGQQTLAGACRSALYGTAFQLQAANARQAFNHVIQGSGAHICKVLQAKLWCLQPTGIHSWVCAPFNIHDEVMCPVKDAAVAVRTQEIANEVVQEFKNKIPLIKLDWKITWKNWGDK